MVFLYVKNEYAAEVLNRFSIENYNFVCNTIVPEQKIGKDENCAKVYVTL